MTWIQAWNWFSAPVTPLGFGLYLNDLGLDLQMEDLSCVTMSALFPKYGTRSCSCHFVWVSESPEQTREDQNLPQCILVIWQVNTDHNALRELENGDSSRSLKGL